MKIDEALVRKLAGLARLELEGDEAQALVKDLEAILGRFEALAALDVDDLPPTRNAGEGRGVRPDDPCPSLAREDALADAPDPFAGAFRVPRVI